MHKLLLLIFQKALSLSHLLLCLSVCKCTSGIRSGIWNWNLDAVPHSLSIGWKTFAATIINDGDGDGEQ